MIIIITAWIFYFLLALSIGAWLLKLIQKHAGVENDLAFDIFYSFWFGFIFLVGLLQLISLFFPIDGSIFLLITLLGLASVIYNYGQVFSGFKSILLRLITRRGLLSLFIISLMLVLVSYSANKEIEHADTFIYHFNAVRWVREFAAVPGLVNLHNRLGFNSSFFLFAALTDSGVFTNESAHIAVSFLLAVCMVHWFIVIANSKQPVAKRIFCLLTFSYLLIHSFWKLDANSLSTDCPTAVLSLEFCLILLDNNFKHKLIILLPLAATIFAFKLSGMLTVGFGIIVLIGYYIKWRIEIDLRKETGRILFFSLVLFGMIITGFLLRNAVVSGWLVYPAPFGNLHLPWSAPEEKVTLIMDWIKSYPKLPGGASPTIIKDHDFFYWFVPWLERFRQTTEFDMFCISIVLVAFSFFNIKSLARFYYGRLNLMLLMVFAMSCLLFWFVSAPDVRFGSIYFYIFLSGSAVLANESFGFDNSATRIVFVVFIFLFVKEMRWFVFDRKPTLFTFGFTKPLELRKVRVSPEGEKPELYIYMPATGDACGDSPLPCTPQLDDIRERVPGDLAKGFLPIPR